VISELVNRLHKGRWDPQPTQQAAVLLASAGEPFPRRMVRLGIDLAGGDGVAVVTIARMYGSSWGLPNPGLMPTKREMAVQRDQVDATLRLINAAGVECWGQVVTTRNAARSIAHVAAARGAGHVLVVCPAAPRWRRIIEGDIVRAIQRRVGAGVVVEGVEAALPAALASR
jgi:hypothetical protein